jgi:hypothetical protein
MSMSAPGMDLMKQVYDGEKGMVEQMGQRMPAEGDDLAGMKEQGNLFPEQLYGTDGYKAEVKGVEDVDGKSCYKLVVSKPSGTTTTEYYDAKTYLKVKELQVTETQGQTMTTTTAYDDYRSVDGILVPHTMTITGPMPTPMVMKASDIKINPSVDPSIFKI